MEAVEILGKIFGLASEIKSRVESVKANKKQCERLAKRINIIVQSLQEFKEKGLPHTAKFMNALKQLETTLEECSNYIQEFDQMGKIRKFFQTKTCKNRFQEFNDQLVQAITDLNL